MKTKLFFIAMAIVTLISCQTVNAQLKYGLHAGMNLETQAELGQLWNNADLFQGFLLGGFLDYPLGKNLSVQTELNYQKKGEKYTSYSVTPESEVKNEFNYLNVPLLVKYNFNDPETGKNWDFNLFTGPYMGYLTSASSYVESGNNTTTSDIEDQVEKTDWGVIFGGGVAYKLGNGGAIIGELRYQMGLSEVDKNDPDLRNKGMGITIGYRF
jgi:hypothetical protein